MYKADLLYELKCKLTNNQVVTYPPLNIYSNV